MDVKKIDERVFVLKDATNCCTNLVIGDKYALVFDTGRGVENLRSAIEELTELPLLVINSHGHYDHVGSNSEFDRVFLPEEEFEVVKTYSKETLDKWCRDLTGEDYKKKHPLENTRVLNFDHFDLGNLECKIIPLPGHTEGSIGILIPKLKILLSGDALLPVSTLIFSNHLTREELLKTLNYTLTLDFEYYLTSHHERAFKKEVVEKIIGCIKRSYHKKFYEYDYPEPPYSRGYFYLDSLDEDGIGLIISKEEFKKN